MWRKVIFIALILGVPAIASCKSGPEIMLSNADKSLSAADRQKIFDAISNGELSSDGNRIIDSDGKEAQFAASFADLNDDGVEELFITGGNSNMSGVTGSSIWAFVKDAKGRLHPEFGFPAAEYKILKSTHHGFHDVEFFGAGFCNPIWKWDGNDYIFYKTVAYGVKARTGC